MKVVLGVLAGAVIAFCAYMSAMEGANERAVIDCARAAGVTLIDGPVTADDSSVWVVVRTPDEDMQAKVDPTTCAIHKSAGYVRFRAAELQAFKRSQTSSYDY
jgi:hypothetical protein